MGTLVSCLCVTEDRPGFLPWLLWNYDRQVWPDRELVIVDSSTAVPDFPARPDVRIVRVPHGTHVGAKRNVALDEARGDVVAWFDDDDWQHPERLHRIVAEIDRGAPYVGQVEGWFVDLRGRRCARYRGGTWLIFNGSGFSVDVARRARFDENDRRGSDTRWLRRLRSHIRTIGRRVPGPEWFVWLCHDHNLTNPASRRRFALPLDEVRHRMGSAWDGTDEALAALCVRLGYGTVDASARGSSGATLPAERVETITASARQTPSVSAFVKASVLDAPYLDVTVRHMFAQARFPFAERFVVVDPREQFTGKYTTRTTPTRRDLDAVLDRLVRDAVVDQVLEVDERADLRRRITETYFGEAAPAIPTHAGTGGPIYATLFGLEACRNDHVVQLDADMLFHASGGSWVEAGLDVLERDESIWLVMTHAGPPAGPVHDPNALGSANRRRARWDPRQRVWRFATASTRYFLCDRRRLRNRLQFVSAGGGCAALEVCISAALRKHGASRANLALEGSWDLHPACHEHPFPQAASAIAAAVERGDVPSIQRGCYDLRVDRPKIFRAWSLVLGTKSTSESISAPDGTGVRRRPHARVRYNSPARGVAPLAVVIAVRNRSGARVRNALASLEWQTAGRVAQVTLVSHGSSAETDAELEDACREFGADLIVVGNPDDAWCKPLALNTGIRASDPALSFLMTMDVDMILAPDFVANVLSELRQHPKTLVLCQSSDLPRQVAIPGTAAQLLASFDALRRRARLRGTHGTGGVQAAPRRFFFDSRGYDEDMRWWGAEDNDFVGRAEAAGLGILWISELTSMLHQWHEKTYRALADPKARSEAEEAWRTNHDLMRARVGQVTRNPAGWGADLT